MRMMAGWLSSALLVAATGAALAQSAEVPVNDYPTVSRADYIFGCMSANGQSRDTLERCSCSIDQIANLVTYREYEEVETIMSLQQRGGDSVAPLANPEIQKKVKKLKLAQVEAELRCF